jgi:uncharacterized protein (DUF2249 family)
MNRGAALPAALERLEPQQRVDLNVREDIRLGQEPFSRIMAAVSALGPGQVLVLRAPFEPVPLYGVMGERGFAHWTESPAPDDWCVWFYREAAAESGGACARAPQAAGTLVLDVRGLEPPKPMVRVLEALDRLAPGQRLEVRHDRRPIFLYPQLEDRGFAHETDEPEPGLVRIVIRRREEKAG